METKASVCRRVGGALVSLVFSMTAAHAATPVKFTMDWAWQGSQVMWLVAQDKGCFKDEGLNVRIDRGFGGGDVLTKVSAGATDIGFSDFSTLIEFNGKHPNNKLQSVFIVYDVVPSSIAYFKNKGIEQLKDLEGKTIASPVTDVGRVLFPQLAKMNGFDPTKVKWSSVAPELREPMLLRGDADAIVGHVWTQAIGLQAAGAKMENVAVLPYAEHGIDTLGSLLVVRPEWAEKNGDAIRSFIRCVALGINETIKDPDAAIASLKKQDPLIRPQVEMDRLLYSFSFAILTENVKRNGLHSLDEERFERIAKVSAEAYNVPVPKRSDVFDERYLPPREALAIVNELSRKPGQ